MSFKIALPPHTKELLGQCESVQQGWNAHSNTLWLKVNGHTFKVQRPLFKMPRMVRMTITPRYGKTLWTRDIDFKGLITGPRGFSEQAPHSLDALLDQLQQGLDWIATQANPEANPHCLSARFWSDESDEDDEN